MAKRSSLRAPAPRRVHADKVPTSLGRAFADPLALCVGLGGLLLGLALTHFAPWRTTPPPTAPAAELGERWVPTVRSGPHGQLRATSVWITPPEGLMGASYCSTTLDPWVLPELRERQQVAAWLSAAQVPPETQGALLAGARCDEKGCVLRPDHALLDGLERPVRTLIYNDLSRYAENRAQYFAYRWPVEQVPRWLTESALSPPLRARLEARLYAREGRLHFSDIEGVCSQLDAGERSQFIRALNATHGHLLQLYVPEGPPAEELVAYWGAGGREGEVRPLLKALGQHPGGAHVDVARLLPAFARERLYSFPAPQDPAFNCHHSSLNFFAHQPDDRLLNDNIIDEALRRDYQVVTGPARLGDIYAIERPDGHAVHTMVHVADDFVFTKNGLYRYVPWNLSHLDDIRDIYLRVPSLRMVQYRRRA